MDGVRKVVASSSRASLVRCLVVVLAVENEKAMFESMLAAGHLTDPFEIRINYRCTGPADVKIASANCNSHVMPTTSWTRSGRRTATS